MRKKKIYVEVDVRDLKLISRHTWHVPSVGGWKGYAIAMMKVNGKWRPVAMHRLIKRAKPGQHVDHKDGNPLNNKRSNLRFCGKPGNSWNMRNSKNQKKGLYKGVFPATGASTWRAQIGITREGKLHQEYLGSFRDPADAARAYDKAARRLFGKFAAPNFPEAT